MDVGGLAIDESQAQGAAPLPVRDVGAAPEGGTASDRLRYVLGADFEWQLRDNPLFASQAGFHQHAGRLQNLSPQSFDSRTEHNERLVSALEKVIASAGQDDLSATERLHAQLLLDAACGESFGIKLGCHLAPINSTGAGGVHERFLEALEWMRFDTEEDHREYVNRLMAFPDQVDQLCRLLAYGSGMCKHAASRSMVHGVDARLEALAEGDQQELREPLDVTEVADEVREHVDQAIANCFVYAINKLRGFMTDFYDGRVREQPGILSVKDGEKVYEACLRFHTSTVWTAQEIHDLGVREVARIGDRIQRDALDKVSFQGSLSKLVQSLHADPSVFFRSEDELVDEYKVALAKIRKLLPEYFESMPNMDLEVVPRNRGPATWYSAGTADGARPGRLFCNVSDLPARPRYEVLARALHDGAPGHHFRAATALQNEALPDFLRYIPSGSDLNAGRRPMYSAYVEGWALYCQRLGEEMGVYDRPDDLLGCLLGDMLCAVRLVVDTGIHALGWSLEKATGYMAEKTGLAAAACEAECHRCAAWPGQACSHKVGQLEIDRIREKAKTTLGDRFRPAAFHTMVVASGPLPLDALERRADDWLSSQQ